MVRNEASIKVWGDPSLKENDAYVQTPHPNIEEILHVSDFIIHDKRCWDHIKFQVVLDERDVSTISSIDLTRDDSRI